MRPVAKANIIAAAELPTAKFRVLYADAPWSYHDKADAGAVHRFEARPGVRRSNRGFGLPLAISTDLNGRSLWTEKPGAKPAG